MDVDYWPYQSGDLIRLHDSATYAKNALYL